MVLLRLGSRLLGGQPSFESSAVSNTLKPTGTAFAVYLALSTCVEQVGFAIAIWVPLHWKTMPPPSGSGVGGIAAMPAEMVCAVTSPGRVGSATTSERIDA